MDQKDDPTGLLAGGAFARTSVSAAGGNLGAEQIYFARAFEIPKGGGRLRRPEPKKKDTTFRYS